MNFRKIPGRDGITTDRRDFRVEYYRAGGKGGQNVNKRSTACRITHLITGLVSQAREHRTQEQNFSAA